MSEHLLVTGGAGYIGSVTSAVLLDLGHRVTVVDDLSTGHRDAVPDGARFVEGDIADRSLMHDVLSDCDAVVHFAAKSLVGQSVTDPALYYSNNVVGTLHLLEAMREARVMRIVFSSTAATYGEPTETPILETAVALPTNPYGRSKLAIDGMLSDFSAAYGITATSLRYFNVAGANGARGERHEPETHLIPNLLRVARGDVAHARLFGTDYPTPDGTCIRDYVHVVDLAHAHALAIEHAAPQKHTIMNLGSESGYSNREVIDAVRRVTGRDIAVVEEPRRPGDPARLVASSARARKELGWAPERGTLDIMIGDAWRALSGVTAA